MHNETKTAQTSVPEPYAISISPKPYSHQAVAPFYLGFMLGNSVSSLRVLRLARVRASVEVGLGLRAKEIQPIKLQ